MVRAMDDQRRPASRYEDAKGRGFIATRGGTRWPDPAADLFWAWCEAYDRPYVEVRRDGRYAHVIVDLWPTYLRELADADTNEVLDRLEAAMTTTSRWRTGPLLFEAYEVSVDTAPSLASWLAAFVHAQAAAPVLGSSRRQRVLSDAGRTDDAWTG